MTIDFSKKFKKQFSKLNFSLKKKFNERLRMIMINPYHPTLKNHQLHGDYLGYKSVNITGDVRAIFKQTDDSILLVDIGTHSELYG
jgi:addiction module RelE/StbE family toxin